MSNLTYQNPVWDGYFADPFVLRTGSVYYAYGTGPADAQGKEFPILRSHDLSHWEPLGGALLPLADPRANNYWAPEVIHRHGKFLLYYSASVTSSDENQRLRVALSDNPHGPFHDSGKRLLPDAGFSIDADPFIDPRDGKPYLYFATDFEKDEPYGTGICVVPLTDDMTQPAGEIRPVLRASEPWQIYETNRQYRGRLWPRWNCIEGPAVIFHLGKYYCFYSGGAWYGSEYGVDCAIADHPLSPWRNQTSAAGPSILKGIPQKVIGPGHCSIFAGAGGQQLFMAYHAWDAHHTARKMCIDPILWTPTGPKVDGPSTQPRRLSVSL